MRRAVAVSIAIVIVFTMQPVRPETLTLEEHAAAIERASTAPDGDRVVVGHLSRTLGISVDTLRAQRWHTRLGWGDLLIAHRLSRETRLSLDQLVIEFRSGKRWEDIALDHKVDIPRLVKEVERSQEVLEQRQEDHTPSRDLGTRFGRPDPPASGLPTRIPGAGSGHRGH